MCENVYCKIDEDEKITITMNKYNRIGWCHTDDFKKKKKNV